MPTLPPKTYSVISKLGFGGGETKEQLEQRKVDLDAYLNLVNEHEKL